VAPQGAPNNERGFAAGTDLVAAPQGAPNNERGFAAGTDLVAVAVAVAVVVAISTPALSPRPADVTVTTAERSLAARPLPAGHPGRFVDLRRRGA
jgi:hypothetical protein